MKKASSTWPATTKMPKFPALSRSTHADVCIIGGGLTGIMSAYLLAKAGRRVVLLEKDRIGSGATGVTTGFLTQALDTDLHDLIKMEGEENARKVVASHGKAIDLIERIVADEEIECEFVRVSNFLYATNAADYEFLKAEHEAAEKLGVVTLLGRGALPFAPDGHLEFVSQAKFHPLKFLGSVALAAQKLGAEIYEGSEVKSLTKDPLTVTVGRDTIEADCIISATYSPFLEPRSLFLKKAMYVSYVEELRVPSGSIPEGMYEDQANPYHYFRVDPQKNYDRILVGGEDHRADVKVRPSKNIQALEDFIRLTFKDIPYETARKWRGPILEPIDGLAFIGPVGRPDILYAFGFSGSGMTYAAIAAEIFRDTVLGEKNEFRDVYDASRIPGARALMIKGRDYMGEFFHGAVKNSLTYRRGS